MADLEHICVRARDDNGTWKWLADKPGREEVLDPCKRSTEPVVLPSRLMNFGLDLRYHLCLTSDAQIVTDKGPKLIVEIKMGDSVLTHKGRYRTVYKTLEREYEGPMLHILTYNGTDFMITPEHEIYAWSEKYFPAYRGHPVLRQASGVRKGDYLYGVFVARTAHLLKVEDVRSELFDGKVYNLHVMQDESYVIHEGPAVQNCGSRLSLMSPHGLTEIEQAREEIRDKRRGRVKSDSSLLSPSLGCWTLCAHGREHGSDKVYYRNLY